MQTFEITFYEEKRLQTHIQAKTLDEARAKFLQSTGPARDHVGMMVVGEPTIEIENIKPLEDKDVRTEH